MESNPKGNKQTIYIGDLTDSSAYESEHFILRLVDENDAEDLLVCYADPKAQQ